MSKRRKKVLPPWLQGVTVSKSGKPAQDVDEVDTEGINKSTAAASNMQRDTAAASRDGKDSVALNSIHQQKKSNTEGCIKKNKLDDEFDDTSKSKGDKTLDLKAANADTAKEVDTEAKLSMEEVIALSYDEFIFNGSLIYSHNADDCNILCDELIAELSPPGIHHIGLDTEWPVTYKTGGLSKTALVQIATSSDKCYLFHISCMPKFPVMLRKLLEMENVIKVGVNVEYDLWKLEMDYDIRVKEIIQKSATDLRPLANKKLRSAENWSLEGLAKNVLRCRISKDPNIRKCDWSQFPLPQQQQKYAATDASVSLAIFHKLNAIESKRK